MTTRDRPTPPAELERTTREVLTELEDRNADQLRAVGTYLVELASWKESKRGGSRAQSADAGSDRERDAPGGPDADGRRDVDYPADVPERASVTVTDVAGTTYLKQRKSPAVYGVRKTAGLARTPELGEFRGR